MRILLALLLLQACTSDDPVNVSGDYTLAITNGANGCEFANWTVGDTATGVLVRLRQMSDDKFTAELTGIVRVFAELTIGSYIFAGDVTGASFDATLAGMQDIMNQGETCKYRVNADIDGSLVRDNISGTITYRVVIVTSAPDCPPEDCATVQSFNGSRPIPI
jgi:hypothetical protein